MGNQTADQKRGKKLNSKHNKSGRRELIEKLSLAGLSERQIADALKVSKTTVHYWITRKDS